MAIDCVGIIGFGEVGRILVDDLLEHSEVQVRIWDRQFENDSSSASRAARALESETRVSVARDGVGAVRNCQFVLSAVTADQAVSAARSVTEGLEFDALFIDLNSVSPGTKLEISGLVTGAGARFVEAAVMSPILPARVASPILLSGPNAAAFAESGRQLGFSNMRVVSEDLGVASATKMCRSVIVKGMEALVTESLLSARHYGVEAAVLESLDNLFPGPEWRQHARYLISRTLQHGERRAAEMLEAARTVEEAGYNGWMCNATVMRQAWAPQFSQALGEESLEGILDAISSEFVNKQSEVA